MDVICVDNCQQDLRNLLVNVRAQMPEAAVHGCSDPEQALLLAGRIGCDILLTEIDLGRMDCDGLTLGRRLRELVPGARIVFVTGKTDPRYAIDAFLIPADAYVQKAHISSHLKEELSYLLRAKR